MHVQICGKERTRAALGTKASYSKRFARGEPGVYFLNTHGQVLIKLSPSESAGFTGFVLESRLQAAATGVEGSIVNERRMIPPAE